MKKTKNGSKKGKKPKKVKTATWRAKPKAAKRHRKHMETLAAVQLPKDLQGALKLKWAPYAGRNLTYFMTKTYLWETYGKRYERLLGVRFSHVLVESSPTTWMMYRAPAESERLEHHVYQRCADGAYVQRILDENEKNYAAYRKMAESFLTKDLRNADAGRLAEELTRYCDAFFQMAESISCSIIFAAALGRRLQQTLNESQLMHLAIPLHPTLPLDEEKDFWTLIAKLQKSGLTHVGKMATLEKPQADAVQKHYDAYCWIEAYENDPVWTMEAMLARINESLNHDADAKIRGIQRRHQDQEYAARQLVATEKLDPKLVQQFRLAMYHRILGESLFGLGNHATQPLFTAIAKKLTLPKNQIKWFSYDELLDALAGNVAPDALMDRLPQRQKHYLVALGEKQVHAFQGPDVDTILSQLDIELPSVADVKEVKGVSAYPGKVIGYARVVQHVGQIDKVKAGDILVTLNTTPSFIMAMKRSAAIVTDEGGITCHAAIVSRELGIPCIIGTKAGTRLIPDGARIEVDAAAGTVRRLDEKTVK